jgi:gamma-glutamyltranspeptidase/glutathione hydrolase
MGLMANIIAHDDLLERGWHSAEWLHLVAEAMRRAYALRNAYLGDSDFVDIPTDEFLSLEKAQQWRAQIKADKVTRSDEIKVGPGTDEEGTHTTHFSVVDREGNAVAVTTTLNTSYGSGVTVKGAGFLLNNEMDDFAAAPGKPNAYGLVQGEANAIQPRKRMLSSMTPTIVTDKNGQVVLVAGAAGGPMITTTTFQIIMAVIDHGLNAVEAIGAPRIHNQHLPDRMLYEQGGFPEAVTDQLQQWGHNLMPAPWPMADAAVIVRDGDVWTGAAEPREGGALAAGPE